MYKYLAGIQPTSPGFATVAIAPVISRTVGPSSVNATMQTIRGPVHSAWTRLNANEDGNNASTRSSGQHASSPLLAVEVGVAGRNRSTAEGGDRRALFHLLRMSCELPIGTEGTVTVPLLGRSPSDVTLSLLDNTDHDGGTEDEEEAVEQVAGVVVLWSRGPLRSGISIQNNIVTTGGVAGVRSVAVTRNGAALVVTVGSGTYTFELKT